MGKKNARDIKAIYQKMADSGKLLPYLKRMEVEVVTSVKVPKDEVLVLLNPELKQDEGNILSSIKAQERTISDMHSTEASAFRSKVAVAGSIVQTAANVCSALGIMLRGDEAKKFGSQTAVKCEADKVGSQIARTLKARFDEGTDQFLDDIKGISGTKRADLYQSWHFRLSNVKNKLQSALGPEGGEKVNGGGKGKGPKEEDNEVTDKTGEKTGEVNGDNPFGGGGDFGGDGGIW